MNRSISRLFSVACLLLVGATPLFAQVIILQYRHVPPEHTQEFIHRETTYWSEVAQKAVDDGKLMGWELWQRVGGMDVDETPNFLFINAFQNKDGVGQGGEIWNPSAVFPDVDPADISTADLGTVKHQLVMQVQAYVGEQQAQYMRVNYSRASDLARYTELEQTVWQPFITEQMKAGNTDQTSWGYATLMSPQGANMPFNALTADGFQTLSGALSTNWNEDAEIEMPDFTEINEVHDKVMIQPYALVKAVWAEPEGSEE